MVVLLKSRGAFSLDDCSFYGTSTSRNSYRHGDYPFRPFFTAVFQNETNCFETWFRESEASGHEKAAKRSLRVSWPIKVLLHPLSTMPKPGEDTKKVSPDSDSGERHVATAAPWVLCLSFSEEALEDFGAVQSRDQCPGRPQFQHLGLPLEVRSFSGELLLDVPRH